MEGFEFESNGDTFKGAKAVRFTEGLISIDELIDKSGDRVAEHSKVAGAVEIIEALLPKDAEWHPAAEIYEACEAESIEKHTVKRAKKPLGLDQRRASTFQAPSEWRWPTQNTQGTGVLEVPCVPSVPSAKPPYNYTQHTQNTQDTENDSPQWVPSRKNSDKDQKQTSEPLPLALAFDEDAARELSIPEQTAFIANDVAPRDPERAEALYADLEARTNGNA